MEENKEENKDPKDLEAHAAEDMVTKANEAAERLELANREHERLIQKEEALKVNQTLGGKADVSPPDSKEETPQEYSKRVLNNDI